MITDIVNAIRTIGGCVEVTGVKVTCCVTFMELTVIDPDAGETVYQAGGVIANA